MKKIIVAFVLSVVSVAAFALPSPKQIEDALAAHDYQSAKSMADEVLREKPDSARAHLLNAYVLLKGEHNPQAASAELKTAQRLDKKGDVQNSSLFGRTVAEIQTAKPVAQVPSQKAVAQKPVTYSQEPVVQSSSHTAIYVFLTFLVITLALVWFLSRPVKTTTVENVVCSGSASRVRYNPPEDFSASAPQTYVPPVHSVQVTPVYQTPAQQPVQQNSFARDVASTAVGVAAGNALYDGARHMFSGHSRSSDYDYEEERRRKRREEESQSSYSYTPTAPSYTDYEENRSSYSSGSSSSWDSGSSSSSYDSGSSSWDSGSSSSDSGSSWD